MFSAWADRAELRQLRLVGHSLGGAVAARLAVMRPDLVQALVLVSAVGMPSRRRLGEYAGPLLVTLRETKPVFLIRIAADAVRAAPEALVRGGLYSARADISHEARLIRAPTLLVWGERDRLVPLSVAAEWQQAVSSSELVVLPGVGHVPMVERPGEFAQLLLEFLDEPGNSVDGRPVCGMGSAGDDGAASIR